MTERLVTDEEAVDIRRWSAGAGIRASEQIRRLLATRRVVIEVLRETTLALHAAHDRTGYGPDECSYTSCRRATAKLAELHGEKP